MKSFFYKILSKAKIAGLHIHLQDDGAEISLSVLNNKKGEATLLFTKEIISEISSLADELPKGVPIALVFTGKGILNKDYKLAQRETIVQKYYPEKLKEDFFCYEHRFHDHSGLSLCRKSDIQPYIDQLLESGIDIVQIVLGPYFSSVLWELGLTNLTEIPTSSGNLAIDRTINSFSLIKGNVSLEGNYDVSGDNIPVQGLLSYSNALLFLTNREAGTFIDESPVPEREELVFRKIIAKAKYYLLGSFLVILLINFAFYENFRKKDQSISEQLMLNKGLQERRDSIRGVLKAKQEYWEFINQNKTFYSQMLDEIAATVPQKIKLNSFAINPVEGKPEKKKPLNFSKKILITGLTKNTLTLNMWENKLTDINWIREVEVIHFEHEENSNRGEFLIEIQIWND